MYSLSHFTLRDMTEMSATLRRLGDEAADEEAVAGACVDFLYENLAGSAQERACALVRFFRTSGFAALSAEQKEIARQHLPETGKPNSTKCLTLVASRGMLPQWNHVEQSANHRVIPLPSPAIVQTMPMIAQLVTQFGLEVEEVVEPSPDVIMDMSQTKFNVFYVPEARDSPHLPAQEDFVRRYGIESVLGFGGMLPSGDIFAVILFSLVAIPRQTAELFTTLALSVKVALLAAAGNSALSR